MKNNGLMAPLLALILAMGAGYGCSDDGEDGASQGPSGTSPGEEANSEEEANGDDEEEVDLGELFIRMKVDDKDYEYTRGQRATSGIIGAGSYSKDACGPGVNSYNITTGFFADPEATSGTLDLTLTFRRCFDAEVPDRCVITDWLEGPRRYSLEVNPSEEKDNLNLSWTDPDAEPGTFASYHGKGKFEVTHTERKGAYLILEGTIDGTFIQTSTGVRPKQLREGEFRLATRGCVD